MNHVTCVADGDVLWSVASVMNNVVNVLNGGDDVDEMKQRAKQSV